MSAGEGDGTPVGRRVVLGMLGLGAVGVAVGAPASDTISRAVSAVSGGTGGGASDLLPAGGGFRYYSVTGTEPTGSRDNYRLRVDGLVDRPHTYRFAELAGLPQTSMTKDFQCVTGWRVLDVRWRGVRLADLLRRAGISRGATAVRFRSFDGTYTESLTLAQAMRPDVLVALAMYGKPVTRSHGGPVRLYAAAMYGYKSLKWLDGVQVTDEVVPGYWERRGYDIDAWVGRSNGRDDEPIG